MFRTCLIISQVLLAVIYTSAGVSKFLHGFPVIIGPVWLIEELSKYGLGLFGYLIAVAQLVTGLVLFFPIYRLIGALMLLPMQLCITVVTISLGWSGTPYINLVLLGMVLALIYDEREKLAKLVGSQAGFRQHKVAYVMSFIGFWSAAALMKYGALLMNGA